MQRCVGAVLKLDLELVRDLLQIVGFHIEVQVGNTKETRVPPDVGPILGNIDKT